MKNKKVETLLKKIEGVKQDMSLIENMRPGSLTEQNHKRGDKQWPYWQISYTLKKRSRTEYIRDEFVDQIRKEIEEYKKFKILVDKLVELSIEISKERIKICKEKLKK